jgi:DNA-binding transcriptional LysR family regulator
MDSLSGIAMFVQVAETRSFTETGRLLGVSSSAVGKSIARTEERLGVRLFHRNTRSITLTAEGALFLERCRRILGEVEAAEAELSDAAGSPRGRLRISTPQLTGLIMPALDGFMVQYPEIELDIDFSDRMVDIIEEGFDAVIRTGEQHDSRLVLRRLGSCDQVLVASTGYLKKHGVPKNIHPNSSGTPACCINSPPAANWNRGRFGFPHRKRSLSCRRPSSATPLKCSAFSRSRIKDWRSCQPSSCGMRWRAEHCGSCWTISSTRPSPSGSCGRQAVTPRPSCVSSSTMSARICKSD